MAVHRVVEDWTARGGRESLRHVNEVLRRGGVDVVHAFFPDSEVQGRYQLPAAVGLRQAPLVTTWWNLGLGRRSPIPLRLSSLALAARSAVLTSHDPGYLRVLRRLAAGRPVAFVPVGNNLGERRGESSSVVRERYGLGDGPIVGFFGHLDFTRGVEDLFAAIAALPDVRLVMIGAGDAYPQYRELPLRLGIGERVVWTGYLDAPDAGDALAAVDLCVLPYRRNSIGRSAVAAALSYGVPTVLGGSAADVEPLVPGRDVALAPRGDVDALAATIDGLVRDAPARAALAQGARDAAAMFAWPRIAERAEAVYRMALR